MASTQWMVLPFQLASPGQILAAGIVLPIVCIALAFVRIRVRQLQKLSLGIDDWLICIGVLFITGMGSCFIIGERLGVMGYPTPVPVGTNASEAYGLFITAYVQFAKVRIATE